MANFCCAVYGEGESPTDENLA